MVQGVKIKGRRRPDEVARSAKGRRRRPVERAPEAPRFHVCALRAHFQQKYGKEKHERDKQGSFPGSFVRSTVQVKVLPVKIKDSWTPSGAGFGGLGTEGP